jgi:hypothetical protein
MSILGIPVPFGQEFERAGTTLVNRVMDDFLNTGADAARLTVVVLYNHTDNQLFLIDSGFESGGFTPGRQAPFQIDGNSSIAYRVESHGAGTGVTGARVRYGLTAGDPNSVVLDISTSNPFFGDNHSETQGSNGFGVTKTDSTGNSNQVDVDLFQA